MAEPSTSGDDRDQVSRVSEHQKPVKTISPGRRITRGLIGLAVIAYAAYEAATGTYAILIGLAGFLAILGLIVGAVWIRSGITYRNGKFHGHLYLAFHEDGFPSGKLFDDITWVKGGVGRQDLSGGHATFSEEGIKWVGGSFLTPKSRLHGEFTLPWSDIAEVDVSTIPLKAAFLGGALTVGLTDGRGSLAGEFLGSRRELARVLRESPLGNS